jgi:hypothetical protein
MRERPIFVILYLYIAVIAGSPTKPKGADFWQNFKELDIVQVNTLPDQTVNLTLSEFKTLADQNRVLHNSVLPMAKVNSTLFPYNTLLYGNGNMSSVPGDDSKTGSGSSLFGDINWPTLLIGGHILVFLLLNYINRPVPL